MYFDTKIIVEFCCTHKLSINEFFILYLTYRESISTGHKRTEEYKLLYRYIVEVEGLSTNKERIKSLETRGFCIDKNVPSATQYFPDQVELKPKFYNNLFKLLGGAADEVWEAFPPFITSDSGGTFPARTISPEDFELIYNKAIKNDPVTHKKVLDALEKQKKEGNIVCGLKKWIECKYWEIETKGKTLSFNRDI